MKTTVKIVAVMMLAVMLCLAFVSCGKMLSGTYVDALTSNVTYEFSGNKYTKTVDNIIGADTVIEGKYEIDEDAGKITFTYEVDDEEKVETKSFASGEENGVAYIKIDGFKYNKQ